jgi:hypothetical protein
MKYLIVVVAFLSLSLGLGQPLAELAPADAALSFGWTFEGGVYDTIDDDIKTLDWSKGKVALEKLLNFLALNNDDPSFQGMFKVYEAILSGNFDQANEELYVFCLPYKDVAAEMQAYTRENGQISFDALMTVSFNSLNPMPAMTALMRVDEAAASLYSKMQNTLLTCAKDAGEPAITELEQDGVTLYVVDDAGDFPVVAGSMGNLYFMGTNPDVIRSVVRQVNGADEKSLADTALYQTASTTLSKTQNSVTMTADFDALAGALGFASDFAGDDPTAQYALTRLDSMLRTLGGWAGHISMTPDGVQSEGVLSANPEGGDTELLKLINCETCKISSPFLAPEKAIAVSSTYLPIRELFAYADDWVRGVSEAAGEPTNIRDLFKEADVDIDTLLLNWIGSEAHTFVLEPYSTDAKQLLYGQPQVTVMPVSSPEAAQAGLNAIGEDLWEILPMLVQNGFSATDLAGLEAALDSLAVREYDYKGTTIHRVQYSFNGDLGYAFVGNYLVLGTPAKAIESMIDTYRGGRTILESSDYQEARKRAPEKLTNFAYSQNKPNILGLAQVFDLLSQPVAFAVSGGFQAMLGFDDSYDFEPYSAYLEGYTAEPLSGTSPFELEIITAEDETYLTRYYELGDLVAGSETTINVSSSHYEFYPYISLVNKDTSMYIASGEYQDDGSYQVVFTAEEGVTYWLEVTGSVPSGFSPYEAELDGYTAELLSLSTPGMVELRVKLDETDSDGYITKYYELKDLVPGETVQIKTFGEVFLPYLNIVDVDGGQYIASSEYQDDGSYMTTFTVEEGKTYWLEVNGSLYDESATFSLESTTSSEVAAQGPLPLTVNITSTESVVVEEGVTATLADAPTFEELLDAAELLPQLIRVIAEHSGTSEGYSQIEGNQVYSKSIFNFRW